MHILMGFLIILYFVVLLGYRWAYLKRLEEVREHERD